MSNRYQTLSFVTASIAGLASSNINRTGLPSLFNIVKVKVVPTLVTGSFDVKIYKKDTFLSADLLASWPLVTSSLFYPVDITSGEAEALEGPGIPYDDSDGTGELHLKITNNAAVSNTYTITIEYEETGLYDAAGNLTIRGTLNGSENAFAIADQFNFSAQSPGGSLTSGITNTITLSPVPRGINGADTNHYLYISGGTGTAEAVLITGGTAISGATSGTITFVPANAHSGTWTIKSASGGLQEAGNILLANNFGGTVFVTSSISAYAPIYFQGTSSGSFTSGPSRLLIKINPSAVITFPNGMTGDGISFIAAVNGSCPGTPTVHMLYSGIEGGKIWAGSNTNTITGNLVVIQSVDFAIIRDVEFRGGATSAIKVVRCYGGEISGNLFVHNGSSVWNTNGLICDSANAMRLFNNQHYDNLNATKGAIYSDAYGEIWTIDQDYFEGITGRVIYQKYTAGTGGTSWKLINCYFNANIATQPLVQFDGNRTTVIGNTFKGTTNVNPILNIANIQNKIIGNEFTNNVQTAPDILISDVSNTVIGNTFAHKDTSAGSLCINCSAANQIITGNIFYDITGSGRLATINADGISITHNTGTLVTAADGFVITPGTTSYAAFNTGCPDPLTDLITASTTTVAINGTFNVVGRKSGNYGSNTAAANDLTIPADANTVTITGNTQINAITLLNWPNSSVIRMLFTGTPTVKNNTAGGAGTGKIRLAGAADFVASNLDVLTLMLAGSEWYEVSRSVN